MAIGGTAAHGAEGEGQGGQTAGGGGQRAPADSGALISPRHIFSTESTCRVDKRAVAVNVSVWVSQHRHAEPAGPAGRTTAMMQQELGAESKFHWYSDLRATLSCSFPEVRLRGLSFPEKSN